MEINKTRPSLTYSQVQNDCWNYTVHLAVDLEINQLQKTDLDNGYFLKYQHIKHILVHLPGGVLLNEILFWINEEPKSYMIKHSEINTGL